jgi:hypothetical protein
MVDVNGREVPMREFVEARMFLNLPPHLGLLGAKGNARIVTTSDSFFGLLYRWIATEFHFRV